MSDHGLLVNILIYLLAAVVAVPISKRIGLGSVLGYLIGGVAIGPWGLGIINNVQDILHFSEFGVVLLLFLIGLELNPKRLWDMRRPILGMGGSQLVLTTLAVMVAGLALGLHPGSALIVGMALSMSSTAIALQILTEKGLLPTPAGNSGFSILLFQDLAVIPVLALIPLLAPPGAEVTAPNGWQGFFKAFLVIAVVIVGGRYLLRPAFRFVASTRVREIFTAFSLLLVIGIALLMQAVQMSMALGAFLAGVLLAESEYRHALESDIEPFKGLLLGLFFISVGMSIDFGLLFNHPGIVLMLVVGLVAVKFIVLLGLARWFRLPPSQFGLFASLLSQGGEFAFVLLGVAAQAGAIDNHLSELLIVVVALSMMATPLLMTVNQSLIEPRFSGKEQRPMDLIEDESNPVLIAGFGRFGQIVGRLLHANGIGTTILDHDPEHVDMVRKFGFKVFYGDASRLDLLRTAGAEQAKLLVVAVDHRDEALEIVEIAHTHFPNLRLLTRAWDLIHVFEFYERGVPDVERETFEGALHLAEEALRRLGFSAWRAKQAGNIFRAHDRRLLAELYQHYHEDLEVRAAIATSARERFEEQMQADETFFGRHHDGDWR